VLNVSSLVDLLNDSTPLFPPLGPAVVAAVVVPARG
jgi:hypothetical protein